MYIKNFDKEDLVIYEWPANEKIGPDYQKAFESQNVKFYAVTIPTGYYTTAQQLGDKLRREFTESKRQDALLSMLEYTTGGRVRERPTDDSREQKLFFEYDFQKARARFRAKTANFAIAATTPDFSKNWVLCLLASSNQVKMMILFTCSSYLKSRVVATAPPEFNIYHLMKIYVDCIEETIVANTLTQEIGTVTVPDYSGQ